MPSSSLAFSWSSWVGRCSGRGVARSRYLTVPRQGWRRAERRPWGSLRQVSRCSWYARLWVRVCSGHLLCTCWPCYRVTRCALAPRLATQGLTALWWPPSSAPYVCRYRKTVDRELRRQAPRRRLGYYSRRRRRGIKFGVTSLIDVSPLYSVLCDVHLPTSA